MELFAKMLQSQESGYSGDTPDQRGKYMLIPIRSQDFFPGLTTSILNDTKVIRVRTIAGASIALNLVYHNAKFFPELLSRAHNEIRLYRNSFIDEALGLDRDVIVVMLRKSKDEYSIDSIQPSDRDYDYWKDIVKAVKDRGPIETNTISKTGRIATIRASASSASDDDVINKAQAVREASAVYSRAREQQPAYIEDPCKIMSALFRTQKDFSDYVRMIYDNKCALRGTSLVANSPAGLEAAHIKGHSVGGPLLPSNGFLLSADLHKCFDQGVFALDDANKVIINKTIPSDSDINNYLGKVVQPITGYELCKPFHLYNKYHRQIHFV